MEKKSQGHTMSMLWGRVHGIVNCMEFYGQWECYEGTQLWKGGSFTLLHSMGCSYCRLGNFRVKNILCVNFSCRKIFVVSLINEKILTINVSRMETYE